MALLLCRLRFVLRIGGANLLIDRLLDG